MLSHTVINPSTMMVILLDASFAYLAMITSFWFSFHTFYAHFPGIIDEFGNISLRFFF